MYLRKPLLTILKRGFPTGRFQSDYQVSGPFRTYIERLGKWEITSIYTGGDGTSSLEVIFTISKSLC